MHEDRDSSAEDLMDLAKEERKIAIGFLHENLGEILVELKRFKSENGHLNIPINYKIKDGLSLGRVIQDMRRRYRFGDMPEAVNLKLKEAGLDLDDYRAHGANIQMKPGVVDYFCNKFGINKSSIRMNYRTLEKINAGLPVREFAIRDFYKIFNEYEPISYQNFINLSLSDLENSEQKILKIHSHGQLFDVKKFNSEILLESDFSPERVEYFPDGNFSAFERKLLLKLEKEINNMGGSDFKSHSNSSLSLAFEHQDNLEDLKNTINEIDFLNEINIYYAAAPLYERAEFNNDYFIAITDAKYDEDYYENVHRIQFSVPMYKSSGRRFFIYITKEKLTNHRLLINCGLPFKNTDLHKKILINQPEYKDATLHVAIDEIDLQQDVRVENYSQRTDFILGLYKFYGLINQNDKFCRELYVYPNYEEFHPSWTSNNKILNNYSNIILEKWLEKEAKDFEK